MVKDEDSCLALNNGWLILNCFNVFKTDSKLFSRLCTRTRFNNVNLGVNLLYIEILATLVAGWSHLAVLNQPESLNRAKLCWRFMYRNDSRLLKNVFICNWKSGMLHHLEKPFKETLMEDKIERKKKSPVLGRIRTYCRQTVNHCSNIFDCCINSGRRL